MKKPAAPAPTAPKLPPTGPTAGAALGVLVVDAAAPTVAADVMVLVEPSLLVTVLVTLDAAVRDACKPPAARPTPVEMVVVSWSDAVGRAADTVTPCASVEADAAYEVVEKPQRLTISLISGVAC